MKYFTKNILPAIALVLLLSIHPRCFATESQMKDTLVEIINQLQAIKPLINQAQQEQPQNPRIKIQFDTWIDAYGQKHNGLRQDIEQIQQALTQVLNQQSIEPRSYAPITNDFIRLRPDSPQLTIGLNDEAVTSMPEKQRWVGYGGISRNNFVAGSFIGAAHV